MKLLTMRMMMKPYICMIGGNVVGEGSSGSGSGVFCHEQHVLPLSSSSSSKEKKHIKVIKPDGVVTVFDRPIKASEVMNDHPKHMVCRSDSLYIGQIIPHLSQQDKLQRGHTYFLLPSHIFHTALSFVTIASFASPSPQRKSLSFHEDKEQLQQQQRSAAAALVNHKAVAAGRRRSPSPAFDIQKTTSGTLRIRVSEVFISQLITEQQQEEEEKNHDLLLCTTPQLHKEYKQLVMESRVRHWKPKLEMITEKHNNKSSRKTLLSTSASFSFAGIKRNNSFTNKSSHPTTTNSCPLPPPPAQLHRSSSLPLASSTKSQSTCKLRRFKLKLRGLTTTTTTASNSPSCRYPKSRKQH